jgi:hypothetical protein
MLPQRIQSFNLKDSYGVGHQLDYLLQFAVRAPGSLNVIMFPCVVIKQARLVTLLDHVVLVQVFQEIGHIVWISPRSHLIPSLLGKRSNLFLLAAGA